MPLTARDVAVSFGGVKALSGVSLSVEQGQIHGLIGPNGAGKSTLFNVISGHIRPRQGEIMLDGHDISRLPTHHRIRAGIGRTFQTPRPFSSMTVYENLLVAARFAGRSPDPVMAAREVLADTQLAEFANTPVTMLNVTTLKRLEVGRALAVRPEYLLLDEVFAGLNPTEKVGLGDLLRTIAATRNLGILLVEHDLRTVFSLSCRVTMLDQGRLVISDTPERVAQDPDVIRAYIGEGATA